MNADTLLAFDDREQSILEWALDYGITPEVIIGRLRRGATVEEAISTPMRIASGQQLPIFHCLQRARYVPAAKPKSPAPAPEPRKPQPRKPQPVRTYTVNGVERTFMEWAASLGMTPTALAYRVKSRGSLEAALSMGERRLQRAYRG